MYTMLAYFLSALLGFLLYVTFKTSKQKNAPPGPTGYPILGSFLRHMTPVMFDRIPVLAKKYGNIYQVNIFNLNFVFLSGYDLIKDVFRDRGTRFSDRYFGGLQEVAKKGLNAAGIVSTPYGPKWAAHRKLFHTTLKKLGLNKKGLENNIENELPYIEEVMQGFCDKKLLINPAQVLDFASLNIISVISMGNRYDYNNKKFKKLIKLNHSVFSSIGTPDKALAFYVLWPGLGKIWRSRKVNVLQTAFQQFYDFFEKEIENHKLNLDKNAPKDFIDHYLIEMQADSSNTFTPDDLKVSLVDFFQAGTETSATTLRWAILYMVNYPDIQNKCRQEINTVIGNKNVTYGDRIKLPFCDATILEVQRKATIAPIGIAHKPLQDETIAGYNISKNTMIFPWYPSVHNSPEHWQNPEELDPNNFLDEDGKVSNREAFFPYGGGRRICLGMEIAKIELFVFFVGILQKFKFSLPEGVSKLSEKPLFGVTCPPENYEVVIENV